MSLKTRSRVRNHPIIRLKHLQFKILFVKFLTQNDIAAKCHVSGIIQTNPFTATSTDRQTGVNSTPFWANLRASHKILFPLSKYFPSEWKQAEAFYFILIKWKSFLK